MGYELHIRIDRSAKSTLAEQIYRGVIASIRSGVLAPGARLPSWITLAGQLGVARGTVKTAYERLVDEQIVVSSRSGGTRIARRTAVDAQAISLQEIDTPPALYRHLLAGPGIFRMGVPPPGGLPANVLARLRAQAARMEVDAPAVYPDPRGEAVLRRAIAAHVALARGLECSPSQIFITAGFAGALGLTLRVLDAKGRQAWVEDPGFFQSRMALEFEGLLPVGVPVDEEGMDVFRGKELSPDAALALVTAGQQAPLGATLSLNRRQELIAWAARTGAWIIEDDYLGELQLTRRAAPALASLDRAGRVIHIGSFSKTISPALRLGFIVAPPALVSRFVEATLYFGSAPGPAVQQATARFMQDGHYMRHLGKLKRIYAARGEMLRSILGKMGYRVHIGGLAVVMRLPSGVSDTVVCRKALELGMAPSSLSTWFVPGTNPESGLLLGVATVTEDQIPRACEQLDGLIRAST
ncbi:PLP-dependent aminotransferase family protein [Dyella nitratireducens]|uniref:MocR-like pyridoxine biosynthesis transcription factor PdxR n=1 Tax=Dyella nitratireducens TaxID=1849580 RepID=UPI00166A06FD|nr:PLP-dependent aminotransferase family protein [Dyella nitratireducens]GLQ42137.1 transcriptional regulator [Dyella nitratireducens]